MKIKCLALFCSCFLLMTVADRFLPGTEARVYGSVIRLHVLAESDGEYDQSVKLSVRDAILSECADLFGESESREEAELLLASGLDRIKTVADRTLSELGAPYTAEVLLGNEDYPERVYDGFSLPAGNYLSLRVVLGTGGGQNWWCILFPPLCSGVAKGGDCTIVGVDRRSSRVFTSSGYRFRFRLLELLGW